MAEKVRSSPRMVGATRKGDVPERGTALAAERELGIAPGRNRRGSPRAAGAPSRGFEPIWQQNLTSSEE